jgi:mannose/fructose/N-acetylgalactosamine-specific phosphotransferase system component IID
MAKKAKTGSILGLIVFLTLMFLVAFIFECCTAPKNL